MSVFTNVRVGVWKRYETCPEMCTEKGTPIHLHYRLIRLTLISVYKHFTSSALVTTSPFADQCHSSSNYQNTSSYHLGYIKMKKTMAGNKRTRPPGGFYSILTLSSADLELDVPRQTNHPKPHQSYLIV